MVTTVRSLGLNGIAGYEVTATSWGFRTPPFGRPGNGSGRR